CTPWPPLMILSNSLVQGFSNLSMKYPQHSKPGECPPQAIGRRSCTRSCVSDSNCPNNEKCCSNGCGRYCTAPYTSICVMFFWSVVYYDTFWPFCCSLLK
uniref:WAP domain-containing protein n=1 Tax=Sinocyclocheilus anshuiensis TaxID=1608454 RepID=A0A671NRG8_9TELE